MTHGDCFTFGKGKDGMSMKQEERYPFLTETRPDGSKWSDEELQEQRRLLGIIEEDFEKEAKQKQDKEKLKKRLREDKEALRQEIRELKKQYFFLKVNFLFHEYFWGPFHKVKERLKQEKEALKHEIREQVKKKDFFLKVNSFFHKYFWEPFSRKWKGKLTGKASEQGKHNS